MKRILFILMSSTLISATASAGFVFSPAVSYFTRETENAGATATESKFTYADLRFGFVLDMGIYVGGIYSLIDEQVGADSSDFYMGASVGYVYKGFNVIGHYLAIGESDQATGGVKYSGGSGFQFDFGYNVKVTDSFQLGPMLSYRAVSFDEQQVQGLSTSGFGGRDVTSVTPYFAFWFQF